MCGPEIVCGHSPYDPDFPCGTLLVQVRQTSKLNGVVLIESAAACRQACRGWGVVVS